MTIRFAAARRGDSCVGRFVGAAAPRLAANDNVRSLSDDRMLRAALRHFAAHGLGAAEAARSNAETAFFAGNRGEYRWWLGICRMLDRRMAEAVAARRHAANQG
ncbi:MAG: hypothetical protein JF595_05280 [Sphingomonadales bacterium]|nr:hypothetical protein [Sphingomonadales bacterium]